MQQVDQHAGHDHTVQLKQYSILHSQHESLHQFLLFFLFALLIFSQIGLYLWKKKHYRSFQSITLLGLWYYSNFDSPLGCFHLFSAYSLAYKTPLETTTPRITYSWFAVANSFTYSLSVTGYIMIILEIFGISRAITLLFWDSDTGSLGYVALMFIFYGLYFGVLSRDCAEVCTDTIANKMGFTGKSLPAKSIPLNKCCICGESLSTVSNSFFLFGIISKIANSLREKGNSRKERSNEDSDANITNSNYIVTLNCSHKYHEWWFVMQSYLTIKKKSIRGWTMIGKKDTCPYCSEKVQLKAIFKNPWEKQGILWAHLLDSIRYLLVWNPIIIMTLNLVIYFVDPGA